MSLWKYISKGWAKFANFVKNEVRIRIKFSFGMHIGGMISFSGIIIRTFPNC